jgi:hypothetical protein
MQYRKTWQTKKVVRISYWVLGGLFFITLIFQIAATALFIVNGDFSNFKDTSKSNVSESICCIKSGKTDGDSD